MTTPEHPTTGSYAEAKPTPTASAPGSSPKDHAREQMRDVKHRFNDRARDMKEQGRKAAIDARQRITRTFHSTAESGVRSVAEGLRDAADAVDDASSRLRERNDKRAAKYVGTAADGLHKAHHYVEKRSPEELADDAGDVVRRYPALVLGGTLAVGLLLGRFLRASAPEPRSSPDRAGGLDTRTTGAKGGAYGSSTTRPYGSAPTSEWNES